MIVSTTSWYSRCLSGVVEVDEPHQRLVGTVEVVGLVDLVELLKGVPGDLQPWIRLEQPLQVGLVGFGEMVLSPQQGETGSEQVRLERRRPLLGIAALQFPPYQGQAFW